MSLINDLLQKGGNYSGTKDDYMQNLEKLSVNQFYEKMKNDKISKAKCSENIQATKICLDFQSNNDEKCKDFKKAWLMCLKG